MLESVFQAHVIKRLRATFDGCLVIKNDANYLQGIPDWLIIYRDRWAMLEVKRSATSRIQPNQEYYVALFNEMSFAAFIFPENEEEVFDALQRAFKSRRTARVPRREYVSLD